MSTVSDIKLIRTDTTLDLSQKAEKRYHYGLPRKVFNVKLPPMHVVVLFVFAKSPRKHTTFAALYLN